MENLRTTAFILKAQFIYTFCRKNKLRSFSLVSFTKWRMSNKAKSHKIASIYGHPSVIK